MIFGSKIQEHFGEIYWVIDIYYIICGVDYKLILSLLILNFLFHKMKMQNNYGENMKLMKKIFDLNF